MSTNNGAVPQRCPKILSAEAAQPAQLNACPLVSAKRVRYNLCFMKFARFQLEIGIRIHLRC